MESAVKDVEMVIEVAEIVDNEADPDTFNDDPMYRLFAIPTPPPMITDPVIEEVESDVLAVESESTANDPVTEIEVADSVDNTVVPDTFIEDATVVANVVIPDTEIEVAASVDNVAPPVIFKFPPM